MDSGVFFSPAQVLQVLSLASSSDETALLESEGRSDGMVEIRRMVKIRRHGHEEESSVSQEPNRRSTQVGNGIVITPCRCLEESLGRAIDSGGRGSIETHAMLSHDIPTT